jgi:outer membrane protein TolC
MRAACVTTAAALALAGCTTFSPDGGRGDVERLAAERIGPPARVLGQARDVSAQRAAVDARLAEPLTAENAIEVALMNQPALQARLAELGLAEADLVQAGRLRNPVFAYSNKRHADVVEIERAVLVNVAALVMMPLALDIGERRFEQAKLVAAADVVQAAGAVRQAWIRAVAAQERLAYDEQVMRAAEAASELARRMAEVGNFSKLAQLREHAFYADAAAALARSRHLALVERERLARLLGLADGGASLRLPPRLPDLPASAIEGGASEQVAMDRRLDVRIASAEVESLAKSLGLMRATRFVNVLEVGYANTSATGEPRADGYEIEVELPIFDFGDAKVARAEMRYRQALAAVADVAVSARSEVREAYSAYRTALDLARHYRDEIVPLRRQIADEMLLRYNGMLTGVFDLLADARVQAATVAAAIDATRDFWLAESALQLALAGRSAGAMPVIGRASAPAAESTGGH